MNSLILRRGVLLRQLTSIARAHALYTTDTPHGTDKQNPRLLILDHALTKVDSLGWTNASISSAATDLGYSPMALSNESGMPLIEHFLDRALDETCIEADDQLHEFDSPEERLRFLCRVRLRQTQKYVRRWPEAAAVLAQPVNVATAMRHLGEMSSRMWYLAGDRSTRIDWYAKRSSLAAAYLASELYMCEDRSGDLANTWAFLDRRLEDMQDAEHAASKALAFGNQFSRNMFNILASRGFVSR